MDYLDAGEFVQPDEASATLMRADGSVEASFPLPVDGTSATLTLPAQTVPAGELFSDRWLLVDYRVGAQPFMRTIPVRVTPFVPLSVGPEDVRRELGLDSSELRDDEVQIFSAWITLTQEYGDGFRNALTSGGPRAIQANQAVVIEACLHLVDSLQFRVAVKMKAEDSGVDRMSEFDIEEIRRRLQVKKAALLDDLVPPTPLATPSFVLVTPVDVITGA